MRVSLVIVVFDIVLILANLFTFAKIAEFPEL